MLYWASRWIVILAAFHQCFGLEDGPNVCTKQETYLTTVQVSYTKPMQVRYFTWCLATPPRCSKYKIVYTTAFKSEAKVDTRTVNVCCKGFVLTTDESGCIPCPTGKYGSQCEIDCICQNQALCDPIAGTCSCKPGWQGSDCSLPCDKNFYGSDCKQECLCENGGTCEPISGACKCPPGYRGPLCSEPCTEGTYGESCTNKCECQNAGTCDHVTGKCSCSPGWMGAVCDNPCSPGYFGKNCQQPCICHNGASCHHLTGQCLCTPGYHGETCQDECPTGKWGPTCSNVSSTVKPPSEQSNENTTTSLEKRMTEMEARLLALEKSTLRHDVAEIKEILTKQASQIAAINTQLFEIQKPCAGDPPSLRNGKVTDFERSHGSRVRYECNRNFVLTRNSSVRCESGKWEGHPPACGYFDDTFYAIASFLSPYIECHSDFNADKIRFSRAIDTGSGGGLPSNVGLIISQKSARMTFGDGEWNEFFGAYRCGFATEEGSADIVVAPQTGNFLYFPDPPEVASVGDNVTLRLFSSVPQRRIAWSRDGTKIPSWKGRTEVSMLMVKAEDAGIYSGRYEDENVDQAFALLSVRKCKANWYGLWCDQVCPPCYNGGVCHDQLGVCVCPEGFVGSNCETPCPQGFYGADCSTSICGNNCSRLLFCKPNLGCSCVRGYKGWRCSEACNPGWYGAHCKQPCHCADGPTSCNRFTGACSGGCAPGWKGLSCQIKDSK